VSPDEIAIIKNHTDSQSLPDLINLALETAARLGELISINPRNIDLEARILMLTDTKNGDNRTIPLSQAATTILERRISQRGTHSDRLFDVTPHAVTIAFRRAVARARKVIDQEQSSPHHRPPNLTDIRFHDLRREATSRLVEKGLTVMETATITGHRTLEMLRRYTALRVKDMVTKLD
jgi:integrase